MSPPIERKITPAIVFFLFGVLTDFISNGVFKIGAFLIYASVYLVVALTLHAQLARSQKWKNLASLATAAFVAGALGGRFFLAGHSSQSTYMMSLVKDSPITLKPSEGTQVLIVVSEKLQTKLNSMKTEPAGVMQVPVLIDIVKDYGCLRVFNVHDVAGVDVKSDPEASWSWKTESQEEKGGRAASQLGLGMEYRWRPWCIEKSYALEPL